MKLSLCLGIMLFICSVQAGEEIIAKWDFSTGSVKSVDGKYIALKRGGTKIAGEGENRRLVIPRSPNYQAEGIRLKENHPALSPKGAFGLKAEVVLRNSKERRPNSYIWDSMYINYKPDRADKIPHHGFMIYIKQEKNGLLTPVAHVGHGEFSSLLSGRPVEYPADGKCTLVFEYDGVDRLSFIFNGRRSSCRMKKAGGDMACSHYGITIGDRFSNGFSHFDGEIKSVTLYRITAKKK